MKRLLLLALIASPAFAETTVTPGTWDVYSGTSRVASESTEADCIRRGEAMKLAKFGCRTITTVVVRPDPVPEPPVVVPEPPKPEPPKPPGMEAIKANAAPTTPNSLKALSGNQSLSKAGQVLENFELRGGQITVTAPNVRIRNFRIVGDMKVAYGIHATAAGVKDLVIENCEIKGVTNIGIYGHDMTVRRCAVRESGADAFRPTGNSVFEENYCEKIGRPGAHADCVQMLEGSNVVFRRNYFYIPYNDPTWMNSACFMIQVDKGPVSNITLDQNICWGGDFGAQTTGGVKGLSVTNNIFPRKGKEAEYGPYAQNVVNAAGTNLCGNKFPDGQLIPGNTACK